MYTIIIFAVIGAALFAYIVREDWKCDLISALFGCGLGTMLGAFVGFIVSLVLSLCAPKEQLVYGPTELASLRTTDGVSGIFVLGCGGFDSDARYQVLMRNQDGSLTPTQINADSYVRIIEDKNLDRTGYWTTTYEVVASSWSNWVHDRPKLISQELRVPTGSVNHTIHLG